ncbi:ABC transporter permease [Conexibacter woesei]|uniref:Binding-protein-dependent transport systems inner membrane component n=1 Tax=Conexibacter woesei (strain DSM 14684 / CCUG 47730 / CIP 108061 / JCM 11494 / NBRC 100937 / ID131577) TaxID=469383 RepID=D3FDD2_CONWI|nr:ABC transporter permease [Conexibacter woesei]ADB53524.1 binding-protein-dependent transport systems inner membrane component [Conexibacter woesei DSM 14684]
MTSAIGRRVLTSLGILLLASLVIFFGLHLLPGDPTFARLGVSVGSDPAQLAQLRAELGLDRPLVVQYGDWLAGALQLDLGASYFSQQSTTSLIAGRLEPSIELALLSLVVAVLVAVPLAMVSALRPGSALDRLLTVASSAGIALPPFWVGIMLLSLVSVRWGLLPSRGFVSFAEDPVQNLRHMVLPVLTMAIAVAAPIARFLRAALIEALATDWARAARGKGLSDREIVRRYALRNATVPTLNVVGTIVGSMLGGVVVVEYAFGIPGIGSLGVDAITMRDYAVAQGVVLTAAVAFILVTLVVDLLSLAIDPRLRQAAIA